MIVGRSELKRASSDSLLPRPLDRHKHDARQHADYGHDNQELDEGETALFFSDHGILLIG
jgi:hypothetical protein